MDLRIRRREILQSDKRIYRTDPGLGPEPPQSELKMTNRTKLKLAIGLGATCSGCDIAIVDLAEKLIDIFNAVDVVFWPTASDQKLEEIQQLPEGSVDLCFYHGSIANEENREIAQLLRKKAKIMVAFGACACHGGTPGLANLTTTKDLFATVYGKTSSTDRSEPKQPLPDTPVREHSLHLPEKFDAVRCLHDCVQVDYYLPGCPPEVQLVDKAINAILTGKLPEKGATLAPDRILCDECPREREEKKISRIHRISDTIPDQERCFLDQGIVCLGPATRMGCEAKCIKANMPCRGCMGPTTRALDQGAKMIASIGSVLGLEGEEQMTEEEVKALMDQIKDPVGLFYMFTLPSATLNRKSIKK